jgi:predicted MFS family arabinose efflux permease
VVAALIGVSLCVSALPFYTFGVFIKQIEGAFGWSRTQLSAGPLVFMLVLAAASPFVGRVVDRFGIRLPLAVSMTGIALSFALLGFAMRSFPVFLALHACMAAVGAAASPLTYTRVVNGWFSTARGLALGLMLMGTGLAAALAPPLVTAVMGAYGWRAGYFSLAAVVLCGMPLVLWLLHGKENCQSRKRTSSGLDRASGMSLASAVRTSVFWRIAVLFFVLALAITGLVVHFVPLLADAGISASDAAAIAALIGVAVILGRLVVGALVDFWFAPYVAAIALALSGLTCFMFAFGGVSFATLAAIGIGFAVGAEVDLIGYFVARYFGLRAYGGIYGVQYGIFIPGTSVSPVWIGAVFDHARSYTPALLMTTALLVLAVALCLTLPPFPDLKRRVGKKSMAAISSHCEGERA